MNSLFYPVLLLISLTTSVAVSQAQSQWEGYRRTETLDIPIKEQILAATVQIFHTSGINSQEKDFKIVTTNKQKKVTDVTKLDNPNSTAFQVETCRRQNLIKCPISKMYASSTAFIQSGNRIHACRHSFHNWFAMATKANDLNLKAIYPPMILKNYKGEVIYNSAYSPQELSTEFINENSNLNRLLYASELKGDTEKYFAMSEYISFSLNSEITDPSTNQFTSITKLIETDSVYVSGYPGQRNTFNDVTKDPPGNTLVTSIGSIVKDKTLYAEVTNFTSNGNSGGPAFNQNGELIGMFCTHLKTTVLLNKMLERQKILSLWEQYADWINPNLTN